MDTNYCHTTLQILTIAGAIYTYIIQRFERKGDETASYIPSDLS
ncbi:hypothetical protein [Bradyrhizobium sp. CCGE-LA001]|nr:hypothetical protein [Bradyrhizobium sp. CCGE-LA001]